MYTAYVYTASPSKEKSTHLEKFLMEVKLVWFRTLINTASNNIAFLYTKKLLHLLTEALANVLL